jgi:hypothetical protein
VPCPHHVTATRPSRLDEALASTERMPEHIRALIIILVLAAASMVAMRKPAVLLGIGPQDYKRYCLTWLGITMAAFLSQNFWLFSLAAVGGIWFAARREQSPLVLYLFLLFAVSPVSASISGLGVFEQLFELSYSRLLSLMLLLPAFTQLSRPGSSNRRRFGVVDWLVVAYICLNLFLQLSVDTLTNTLRYAFYAFVDVFLPYFVFSRYVVTLNARRQVIVAFVMAMVLMAPIAMFESVRGWLLYARLPNALGLPPPAVNLYIGRGDSLRAMASTGQPIVLGYTMVIAILLYAGIDRASVKTRYWLLGLLALLGGVVAPISRGPWVGLVAGLLVLMMTSPRPGRWFGRIALGSLLALPVMTMTSLGGSFIDHLPFFGTIDGDNVDYRSTLIDVAMYVIWLNPFFGSFDFLRNPAFAVLDQGGGAVDIVNTYIVIALTSGLVGLTLFVGIFFFVVTGLVRALRSCQIRESEVFTQGRILLAAVGATLVVIGTTSSISFIPTVYWCLCGMAVGYGHQLREESRSKQMQ